jgi:hypothetical protein
MASLQLISIRKDTHEQLKRLSRVSGKAMINIIMDLVNKEYEDKKETIDKFNELRNILDNIYTTEVLDKT